MPVFLAIMTMLWIPDVDGEGKPFTKITTPCQCSSWRIIDKSLMRTFNEEMMRSEEPIYRFAFALIFES